MKSYLFLSGRHSLGRSPGDFGVLRSGTEPGSSRLQAFKSRGGGMGFTFLTGLDGPEPEPEAAEVDFGLEDVDLMDKSSGLSCSGSSMLLDVCLIVFQKF